MNQDIVQPLAIFALLALVAMFVVTLAFSYFIVPQAPPTRRAGWISGLAYLLIVTGGLIALASADDLPPLSIPPELLVPIAPLPAALLVFLYWRWSFRRAWVDDDDLPEGVAINEDDWRAGLFRLILLVLIGLTLALIRLFVAGGVRGLASY